MPLSNAARNFKFQCKKKGMSEPQILAELINRGYITTNALPTNAPAHVRNTNVNVNPSNVTMLPPIREETTPGDPDPISPPTQVNTTKIDPQYADMIDHIQYAQSKGVEVRLGEVTQLFDKKNQLESESGDLKIKGDILTTIEKDAQAYLAGKPVVDPKEKDNRPEWEKQAEIQKEIDQLAEEEANAEKPTSSPK